MNVQLVTNLHVIHALMKQINAYRVKLENIYSAMYVKMYALNFIIQLQLRVM